MNTPTALPPDAACAAAACVPLRELAWAAPAGRDRGRTWFPVRPQDDAVPPYEQLGRTLERGRCAVVDAHALPPVDVRPADAPTSSSIGFNPYFDLPPA